MVTPPGALKPPSALPVEATTRWQGTISGIGLWAIALPTARAAFGLPASSAHILYGSVLPLGMRRQYL